MVFISELCYLRWRLRDQVTVRTCRLRTLGSVVWFPLPPGYSLDSLMCYFWKHSWSNFLDSAMTLYLQRKQWQSFFNAFLYCKRTQMAFANIAATFWLKMRSGCFPHQSHMGSNPITLSPLSLSFMSVSLSKSNKMTGEKLTGHSP